MALMWNRQTYQEKRSMEVTFEHCIRNELNFTEHERRLIALLSLELAREGGSCRAIPLKEFAGDTIIDALLQGQKFLVFLESLPSIFQVDRSTQNVKLLTFEFVIYPSREEEDLQKRCAECNLQRRAIYVLRQLEAKQARRKKQREIVGQSHERPGASAKWLAEKCSAQLHQWTRLYRNLQDRSTVQQCDRSIISFIDFLHERKDIFRLTEDDDYQKWILSEKQHDDHYLSEIAKELVLGAVAGGINLSQLLHHNLHLRDLLGGRDLYELQQKYPLIFKDVNIFHNETGYLYIKKSKSDFYGRLQVDEEAQFSVTASKYSAAMANIIFQAMDKLVDRWDSCIAVDMTAGAGGLTLGLAKKFSNVVALEIDSVRAELCRTNMISQGLSNVTVVCTDAMEYVLNMNHAVPLVLIIDPPWGGLHYRRNCQNIRLGDEWPLSAILSTLARRLLIFCVGLKLPLTFDVDKLVDDANIGSEDGRCIRRSFIKKLGRQLFVVLEIPAKPFPFVHALYEDKVP